MEFDGAVSPISPSSLTGSVVEDQTHSTFFPLLDLVRDDGLSMSYLKARDPARVQFFSVIPGMTTVKFTHPALAEYYQRQDGKFLVGLEVSLFKQCLEVFVDSIDVTRFQYALSQTAWDL